ncbi:zinc finger protein 835-like isoform X2 [Engraulis encrasicolus]|uniref:zinc finger protein 835-like isoform X2 n=1 Tax=Engraulis encrasicolus TaxID=184585 RepID=UPI002FD21391
MACDMIDISRHINANHKQACSDLEKARLIITEALQSEIQRNTTLCMLVHRLEERAAENGRSQSEQVESNRQLKLQVDELQKQLVDKDNSLTQAKQSIAVLKNELGDLKQQLQTHQSNRRTIQEVTEWQQDESLTNVVKEENSVQQNVLVPVKVEDANDEYQCNRSDETDASTEQTISSSAGSRTELVQEEDEKLDMIPVVSSDPHPVKFLRLSVQLVDCCATQGHQRTTSKKNEAGENPNNGIAGKASEWPLSAVPNFTAVPETEVDNGRPYKSPACEEDFSSKSAMEKHHSKQDIPTGEKPHLEQDQHTHTGKMPHHHKHHGKRVTRTNALSAQTHSDTGDKRHHCDQCDQSFSRARTLRRHKLIHSGEKPHKCTECSKCFRRFEGLILHRCIHTGEKLHHCGECGKNFTYPSDLARHKLMHTGHKPYCCGECGKSFRQADHLRSHKLIHTGEKPYKCTECSKCFRESKTLKEHQRIHTGERPYCCDQCGKRFRQASSLRKHTSVHTGERPFQ